MITLINPNNIIQRNDIFTSGIVYMPVSLAYFAGALTHHGFKCMAVDAFGEKPNQFWIEGDFIFRGLKPQEVVNRIDPDSDLIIIGAISITSHDSIINIVRAARHMFPDTPIVIMENSYSVTAYSLRRLQEHFFNAGADYVCSGDPDESCLKLISLLHDGKPTASDLEAIGGIGFMRNGKVSYSAPQRAADADNLKIPAWNLFPIRNYWHLKYAHGPFETDKYLPILTSRGCPFACRFCIIPETNGGNWSGRSARNIVHEMEELLAKYGVNEFHVEDVNPTVSEKRIRELCEEILARDLKVIWKLCAGTKIETIKDETTLSLLSKAGCNYISISPETGSPRVLNLIGKSFDAAHAVKMIKKMNAEGIYSQACFILGYPGETDADRNMTWHLAHVLSKAGVDEIALFIIAPLPGSAIYDNYRGYRNYAQLSFSPSWRHDYEIINKFRVNLYLHFIAWKSFYYPEKVLKQVVNFIRRRFQTKMEMTPYRAIKTTLLTRSLNG